METPHNAPAPLAELPHPLKEGLKARVQKNHSELIKKLVGTVFYEKSHVLESLREALHSRAHIDIEDVEELLKKFRSCVPLTNYYAYEPYVSRLRQAEKCCISDIENLLSPGLPVFIAYTSGTSGGASKYFPKYAHPRYTTMPWDIPNATEILMCRFASLRVNKFVEVVNPDGDTVSNIPVTISSTGRLRYQLGITAKEDEETLSQKWKYNTSPVAVALVPSYSSNLYLNVFFALMNPSLSVMITTISTILHDAIRILEESWDTMVHAIEKGYLPDVPNLGEYRPQLEAVVRPNFARAEELRQIKVGVEGWLKKVWPSLVVVRAAFSGQYAMLLPKLQHHFGLSVILQSTYYAATECIVGSGYDTKETNLYRLESTDHIELLDIEKEMCPENLSQPWEVETGRRYEVVVTSHDGLWRYVLSDIVEVAGFSPTDGQPLIRFYERKGVGFQIFEEFVSESTLRQIMISLSETLGSVLEFAIVIDDRKLVRAYGFFVELAQIGSNTHLALAEIQSALMVNVGYKRYTEEGFIGDPTIRVVAPGTFKAYRDWRIQLTGFTAGQIKVPTRILDLKTQEWITRRVIMEVGEKSA